MSSILLTPAPALDAGLRPRRAWSAPQLVELPKLTQLTLQTGDGIPGGASPGNPGDGVIS